MAAKDPDLVAVRPNCQEDTPQLQYDVDQAAAGAHGLTQADVHDIIATAWGGAYVNDFIDRGRVKKVYVQADDPFRKAPEDLERWYVRGGAGEMTPLSTFASTRWKFGPTRLERYNGLPSYEILGEPAPGKSSGAAMKAMERIAAKLPAGIGFEWTGLSYEERLAGNQAMAVYALSLLMVFLCLAALYESWSVDRKSTRLNSVTNAHLVCR